MKPSRLKWPAALILGATVASCGAETSRDDASPPARPVTVLELQQTTPPIIARRTGSVEAYRQEDLAFEVSGRMQYVLDVGREVEGETRGERWDHVVRPGDVIAQIDDTRYRMKVNGLEARLSSARSSLDAQVIDLEQVAKADLDAAEAQLRAAKQSVTGAQSAFDLAQTQLKRSRELLAGGAGSQEAVDKDQAAFDQAQAELRSANDNVAGRQAQRDKARANIDLKRAQVAATNADIVELTENLKNAQRDLEDTKLRAPFPGRITSVKVSQGAFVTQGTPVVTLTLMDPVKVSVTLSAADDRKLRLGDQATIQPSGRDSDDPPLYGVIFEKSEIADPATRTFRVDVLSRNLPLGQWESGDTRRLGTLEMLPVIRRTLHDEGALFVPVESVSSTWEGDPRYVLRIKGLRAGVERRDRAEGRFETEKIPVQLGSEYITIVKWNFVQLSDPGPLHESDMLVIKTPDQEDGVEKRRLDADLKGVEVVSQSWALRPGDLVPVDFELGRATEGFYVPVHAVVTRNDESFVFVVEDGTARRVPVRLGRDEAYSSVRRIEAEDLAGGAKMIVRGVHYVADGMPVNVVGEEESP